MQQSSPLSTTPSDTMCSTDSQTSNLNPDALPFIPSFNPLSLEQNPPLPFLMDNFITRDEDHYLHYKVLHPDQNFPVHFAAFQKHFLNQTNFNIASARLKTLQRDQVKSSTVFCYPSNNFKMVQFPKLDGNCYLMTSEPVKAFVFTNQNGILRDPDNCTYKIGLFDIYTGHFHHQLSDLLDYCLL